MKLLKFLKSIPKSGIARRYFLMNTFDGSLTILGIILALHFAGAENPDVVIISCLGAAIAMGVSGVWGAYATEKAERARELKTLERHVLADLDDTKIGRKFHRYVIQASLVDGLSPLLAALIIISPYGAVEVGWVSVPTAFTLALVIETVILFSLGFIAAKISRESNEIKNGVIMLLAGVVVALITLLLELFR
ncbi:MAG: hypothetical protein ABH834_00030 [Candidatus Altiarchaeota archaeon]